MKRHIASLFVAAAAVAACSSSSGSDCQVEGTYALSQAIDTSADNSCNASGTTSPTTVTVTSDGEVGFQGVTGNCPGKVSACKLTAQCDGTLTGGGVSTIQLSWTFDAKGFHGSSALGAQPTGKPKCSATFVDTATRK